MIVIILFIIFTVSFAIFPSVNSMILNIDTTGWSTITQAEFVVLPFLFLGAVLIVAWAMRHRN